jgi:micrococcal nuclease
VPRRPVLRRALFALLAGLWAAGGCGSGEVPAEQAQVILVIDGDTFDVRLGDGREERIRTPQIDAPEMDECGYQQASVVMADLVLGETVELIPTSNGPDRDAHGRLLRAARLDGDDMGEAMVRSGMARWVAGYAHEDRGLASRYKTAERRAERESAGLWAACGWSPR